MLPSSTHTHTPPPDPPPSLKEVTFTCKYVMSNKSTSHLSPQQRTRSGTKEALDSPLSINAVAGGILHNTTTCRGGGPVKHLRVLRMAVPFLVAFTKTHGLEGFLARATTFLFRRAHLLEAGEAPSHHPQRPDAEAHGPV